MQIVASVAGLAPARIGLKGRMLELLCIHGLLAQGDHWSLRLVSHQRLPGFSEALICLSYSRKWLVEPKLGKRRLAGQAVGVAKAGRLAR